MPVGGMILDKDRLTRFVVGNDGFQTHHDAAAHGHFALVHGHPTPIGYHMSVNVGEASVLGGCQRG